ncbi:hypothetical protein, partial [Legionella israelensis]|uniref:hypothetical protein n=1 Tax=Legionella israelensis TaxID=454 RepID=UPI001EE6F4F5
FNIPSGCLKKSQPIADYAPRLSAFHGAQRLKKMLNNVSLFISMIIIYTINYWKNFNEKNSVWMSARFLFNGFNTGHSLESTCNTISADTSAA